MDSLKTCFFGGYDKLDTLKYIDTITSEIYMLELAIEKKKTAITLLSPEKQVSESSKAQRLAALQSLMWTATSVRFLERRLSFVKSFAANGQ